MGQIDREHGAVAARADLEDTAVPLVRRAIAGEALGPSQRSAVATLLDDLAEIAFELRDSIEHMRKLTGSLSQFLREIRFEGRGDALTRMVMTEISGDVTTPTFSDVDAAHRYTSAEAATVFSLTP